jgi:hypothetical protein
VLRPIPRRRRREVDDDADVGGDGAVLRREDGVEIHLGDFRVVGDEPRHVLDHRGERCAIDRIGAAHAFENLRRGDAVEHRQGVFFTGRREAERDVLEHFHEDAAEAERHQLAEHRIGHRADDHFLAAAQLLLHLDAEQRRLRVVLLRIGHDRVETLARFVGAGDAHQHAARLRLVQDLGRDDLEDDRKSHRRGDGRRLRRARRDAFFRHGDAVGLAHQLAFRRCEGRPPLGFDSVQNPPDFAHVVGHHCSC